MSHLIRVTVCVASIAAIAPFGLCQENNPKRLHDFVAAFPTPAKKDGKLADVDKKATDAALAELLKDVEASIAGLVHLLSVKGNDIQVRHALHALVIRVGDEKNAP